jgi:DNA-binding transcriptional LysR family regulator
MGTGAVYRWELEQGSDVRSMNLDWSVVVSETALAVEVAQRGGGIAYCLHGRVEACLGNGTLQEVLPTWSSDGEAFHIYYPSRRQQSEALKIFIEFLRFRLRPSQ